MVLRGCSFLFKLHLTTSIIALRFNAAGCYLVTYSRECFIFLFFGLVPIVFRLQRPPRVFSQEVLFVASSLRVTKVQMFFFFFFT